MSIASAEALYLLETHKRRAGKEGRMARPGAGVSSHAELATEIDRDLAVLDRRKRVAGASLRTAGR